MITSDDQRKAAQVRELIRQGKTNEAASIAGSISDPAIAASVQSEVAQAEQGQHILGCTYVRTSGTSVSPAIRQQALGVALERFPEQVFGMPFDPDMPGRPQTIEIDTNMQNTNTWPSPPIEGHIRESIPSRRKPGLRGEKSLYDEEGGEWRPHKPDNYHPSGHWNYKAHSKSKWENIDIKGNKIEEEK